MSFVILAPETASSAAWDLSNLRWSISGANAAAMSPTTGAVAAAEDEVSVAIAALFSTYAQDYQALSAQAMAFHDQFMSLLIRGVGQYVGAEAGNAESTLMDTLNATGRALLSRPLIATGHEIAGGAAANPAEPTLGQRITDFIGDRVVGAVSAAATNVVIAAESAVSGLTPLSAGLAVGGAAVGTEVGQVVGGVIGSFIGPEGTIAGVLIGGEIGGTLGSLAGRFGPGFVVGDILNQAGVGHAVGSVINEVSTGFAGLFNSAPNVSSLLTGSSIGQLLDGTNSNAPNLAVDISSLLGAPGSGISNLMDAPQGLLTQISTLATQAQTPLSGPSGFGVNFAVASDQIYPYGADGIGRTVTGAFTLTVGPLHASLGSFQGTTEVDQFSSKSVASATIFGINETASVFSTPGGSPQFSVSGGVPGVTAALQDVAAYFH